jgi:hypothetical protein
LVKKLEQKYRHQRKSDQISKHAEKSTTTTTTANLGFKISEDDIKPQRFVGSLYQACNYPLFATRGSHAVKVCPELNHRCKRCLFRGHSRQSNRCNQIQANLATFEAAAMHGFVTKNRMRNWGAANGFFTVIRLAQLHHIAAHGG